MTLELVLHMTFFSKEDEYEKEDKYNLEHDTSDEGVPYLRQRY